MVDVSDRRIQLHPKLWHSQATQTRSRCWRIPSAFPELAEPENSSLHLRVSGREKRTRPIFSHCPFASNGESGDAEEVRYRPAACRGFLAL